MGDLRALLRRIEDFRHKWEGWEKEHAIEAEIVEGTEEHAEPRRSFAQPLVTACGGGKTLEEDDSAWRQSYERLRQRWETCSADAIVTRWRREGDPRVEHLEYTGALLEVWEHGLLPAARTVAVREQLGWCVEERLRRFETALARVRKFEERIARLSRCYEQGLAGERLIVGEIAALAEELLEEAREGRPIAWDFRRWRVEREDAAEQRELTAEPPAQRVAVYALQMAQVLARMVLQDVAWRSHPLPAMTAALVADIGWLTLPNTLWRRSLEQWTPEERETAEQHALRSAECLARIAPELAALVPVVATHHDVRAENGVGSLPTGSADAGLASLLAVADAYTSRRAPLMGGAVRDSRQALTEVLLLAEQGKLDARAVARLACLSFYPVGTLVELSDGSTAVVLAPPSPPADPRTAHRPLVARLTNPDGTARSCPELVPLAAGDRGVVVRPLPLAGIAKLVRFFPDLV